jgi:hypothetical protein
MSEMFPNFFFHLVSILRCFFGILSEPVNTCCKNANQRRISVISKEEEEG